MCRLGCVCIVETGQSLVTGKSSIVNMQNENKTWLKKQKKLYISLWLICKKKHWAIKTKIKPPKISNALFNRKLAQKPTLADAKSDSTFTFNYGVYLFIASATLRYTIIWMHGKSNGEIGSKAGLGCYRVFASQFIAWPIFVSIHFFYPFFACMVDIILWHTRSKMNMHVCVFCTAALKIWISI